MSVDTQSEVGQADRPFTRADIERLLQEVGSSDHLNVYGKNLRGADLSSLDLHGADLSAADLRGADLTQGNLEEVNFHQAKLAEAHLWGAYLKETQPEASDLLVRVGTPGCGTTSSITSFLERLAKQEDRHFSSIDPKSYSSKVCLSRLEEPLTVHNVTLILSAISALATKYWLIAKGRFADLVEYTQTRTPRFDEEASVTMPGRSLDMRGSFAPLKGEKA